ncbi:ATPase SWSAP1 [Gastrophryne carolinensis]
MSSLMLRVFSQLGEADSVKAAEPGCSRHGAPVLLLGPPGSVTSSLLFMAAMLAAEEGAGPVICLSSEPLQELPKGRREVRDPLILKAIRFMYPPSLRELLQFFSTLHMSSTSPSLILVDGLEGYLPSSSSPADGAHLSALMLDSVSHLCCGLIVSAAAAPDGSEGPFVAVERYFPNLCRLHEVMTTGAEERRFQRIVWPASSQELLIKRLMDSMGLIQSQVY